MNLRRNLRHNLPCVFGLLAFLGLLLPGCTGRDLPVTPYLPPTAAAQSTPFNFPTPVLTSSNTSPNSPAITARPTVLPTCTRGLDFLDDLTIPDGASTRSGETLDKRWRVLNSGTCNWEASYAVKLVAGPDLGAPKEQSLFPARGGTEAIIRMSFTAPDEPGVYRSAWQAFDPEGEAFGDAFFIEIVVEVP